MQVFYTGEALERLYSKIITKPVPPARSQNSLFGSCMNYFSLCCNKIPMKSNLKNKVSSVVWFQEMVSLGVGGQQTDSSWKPWSHLIHRQEVEIAGVQPLFLVQDTRPWDGDAHS